MDILLTRPDSALARQLEAAGHTALRWDLELPPAAAHLAIVHGLDEVARAAGAPLHILAILDPAELDGLGVHAARVADFVIAGARSDEVVARALRIAALPPWSQQRLHEIMMLAVERTSDLIEITDPSARLQFVNAAYKTALGFELAEVIGKTPAQLVRSNAHSPEFFRELDRTLTSGRTWSGTLISKARDGRIVYFDTTITPIADEEGRITHHMAVKRDITEEMLRRKALAEAREALEQARQEAADLALEHAVQRAKRDEELAIATRVQTSILPRSLDVPGYSLAAAMIPATEVGGDYYDVHTTPDAAWLAIGDVSGHGLDSGLVMLMVQSAMSAIVRARPDARPREMIDSLNGVLFENIRRRLRADDHVTFSLFRLAPDGRVTFAGAHEPILVWRARTRRIETLDTPGVWLGAKRDIASVTTETLIELEPGDLLLLYTDGIIEARNRKGQQLELTGLARILEEVVDSPVETIRDHVVARTRAWMTEQLDDMSVVVVRRAPS